MTTPLPRFALDERLRPPGRELRHPAEDGQHAREAPAASAKSARPPIPIPRPAAATTPLARGFPGKNVMSAASDWSRWPLGTKFRIVGTDDVYMIDDYGGALIGTNTIDLYKTNRLAMRKWGVRSVDIDVLEWGSKQTQPQGARPAQERTAGSARMIVALSRNKQITRPF